MKAMLIISLLINLVCIPLATIYVVRKVQFNNSQKGKEKLYSGNFLGEVRNSEFKELQIDSNSIVFLGDSHTHNFEVPEIFQNINVKNRGISYDGIHALLERSDYIIQGKPKKIFLMIGVNDLLNETPVSQIADKIDTLIYQFQSGSPDTKVYVQSILPTNWNTFFAKTSVLPEIINLNKELELRSIRNKAEYVDLYTSFVQDSGLNKLYDCGDGLHLNGKGYVLWRDKIKDMVN